MADTLVITGASGFIGQRAVAEAVRRGHKVRAIVRRTSDLWQTVDGVETIVADLASPDSVASLTAACDGARAVIHLASSLGGDADAQQRDTETATEHLLGAIGACAEPPTMVLASSFSVYGYGALPTGATVDEETPLEMHADQRDAYCRGKLAQEALVRAAGQPAWIVRPGAVLGPDRLWNAHLGIGAGPLVLMIGGSATVPVTTVDSTALALVRAGETPPAGIETVNIVDDDLPDQRAYLRAHRASGWPKAVVPVPLWLLRALGAIARAIPGIGSKLPGLLRAPVLAARMGRFRYDNARAKSRLGWAPVQGFDQAMADAISGSGG